MKKRALLAVFAALSVGICAFAAAGCNPMTAGQGDGDGTEQSGEITGEGTPETPDNPLGFDATVTAETWDAALHFEGVTNVSMRGTVVGAVSQGVINAISRLDGDKVYIRQSAGDMLDENYYRYYEKLSDGTGNPSAPSQWRADVYTRAEGTEQGWILERDRTIGSWYDSTIAPLLYVFYEAYDAAVYDASRGCYTLSGYAVEEEGIVFERAEFTFADDKLTSFSFQLGAIEGVMTFYDYGATSVTLPTEIVPDRTVTKEEWIKAISLEGVDNVTSVFTQSQNGQDAVTITAKIDGKRLYSSTKADGYEDIFYFEVSEWISTGEVERGYEGVSLKGTMYTPLENGGWRAQSPYYIESYTMPNTVLLRVLPYDLFTYNAKTGLYEAENLPSDGQAFGIKRVQIGFEDGKLVSCEVELDNGIYVDAVYFDYGTTAVTLPKATETVTVPDMPPWETKRS